MVLGGGLLLTAGDAPLWALFVVVGAAMAAFGLTVAASVYLTSWCGERPA